MTGGGLRLIRSRFIFDTYTLATFTFCSISKIDRTDQFSEIINTLCLASACLITLLTLGDSWTNRWTVTFPALLLVILQMLRRRGHGNSTDSSAGTGVVSEMIVMTLSLVSITVSALLTTLFPAVEIPPIKGKYNVGIVDLHLPVKGFDGNLSINKDDDPSDVPSKHTSEKEGFVSVRLLYPTLDPVKRVPYYNPDTADGICTEFMKTAAPPPLNKLTWFVNHWKFSRIQAARNAKPIDLIQEDPPAHSKPSTSNGAGDKETHGRKIPIVAFSHGLLGAAPVYSYQMLNLASNGSLVLVVTHADGSAVFATRNDGSPVHYNPNTEVPGKKIENCRARRRQTDYRALELLAAIRAVRALNTENIPRLREVGVSFVGRLDVDGGMVVGGHSFGAATAIEVAAREPGLFAAAGGGLVVYDPVVDWVPDFGRRALFEEGRLAGAGLNYGGGTGGYEDNCRTGNDKEEESSSLHDIHMFFLYSHEFQRGGWGDYSLMKTMHSAGQLGSRNRDRLSDVGFVYQSQHPAFSDQCMMTPLWMARAINITGKRNPSDTAEEIASRTLDFYNVIRKERT